MGGGGKSSSKNTTTSTNVSGQNAIQGDNLGVTISGVNDSNIDVTMTDHGAMERAAELGELALTSNVKALGIAADLGSNAIDANKDIASDAIALSRDTTKLVSNSHSENLQYVAGLAGNQAKQNTDNLETLKELAEMKIDGGQVATSKQMTIVVSVVAFLLIVAFMMRGKK